MTIIGVLLLIMAIVSFVGSFLVSKEPREVNNGMGGTYTKYPPGFVKLLSAKIGSAVAIVGVVFIILGSALFYSRPGHQYFIVNPFGTKYAVMDSGYKLIMPFSRVQEWEKYIDVKVVSKNSEGEFTESTEGVDGVISDEVIFTVTVNGQEVERKYYGIPITFIDKVRGVVSLSSRFELPQDPDSFIKLAEEFRHPMNLVNNTLIPTVREQVINTAYMFSADDYVSGDASNFRQTLDDQLKNGGFAVDKIEKRDTLYLNIGVTEDVKAKDREIREIKTYYKVDKRLDKNGLPIRIEHDITKNKIMISQVIVDDVDLEPKFRQKLEMQRDISAQKGIELQKIETAEAAKKRIAAEGERDKTQERVIQEKEQVKKLIAIETKVKEEESKRQLAVIALETSKLDSQKRKVDAEAKRYELQQADGLSEAEKYIIDANKEVGLANAAAKREMFRNLTTYIESGGSGKGNGSSIMTDVIAADYVTNQLNAKKK
jgi:hypothetical protein